MPTSDLVQFQECSWRSRITAELRDFAKHWADEPPPGVPAEHWKQFPLLIAWEPHPWEHGITSNMSVAQKRGYPDCGGVYLNIDYCRQDNMMSSVGEMDFAVIRWIGFTKKYSDRERKERGKYRYRVKAIIPFHEDLLWVGAGLERYLLKRVNTSHNQNDRGFCFKKGWIFNEKAEVASTPNGCC